MKLLLDDGYSVKACVRDATDPVKTDFLRACHAILTPPPPCRAPHAADDADRLTLICCCWPGRMPGYATGRLTIHSCDLSEEGVFDDVFPGCHVRRPLPHCPRPGSSVLADRG